MEWVLSPTSRGDRVLSASERPKRTVVPGSRRPALGVAALRKRLGKLKRRLRRPQPYTWHWLLANGWVTMGSHSYTTPQGHYYPGDAKKVTIGDWTSIAGDVALLLSRGIERVDIAGANAAEHWPGRHRPSRRRWPRRRRRAGGKLAVDTPCGPTVDA
jgi:hypothetical protein